VHSTEGRCVKSSEEAAVLVGGVQNLPRQTVPGPGMLVEVSPWG